jgi:cytochrome c-type biogenesis protein CcmH/NrfG
MASRSATHHRHPRPDPPLKTSFSARLRPLATAWATGIVLVIFTIVFITLETVSYIQKSATWDESIHLAAGYAALANRDYRVDPSHPPFVRMWAALPLLAMRDIRFDPSAIDRIEPAAWVSGSTAYEFSYRFMYIDNDADRLLYAGRFMVVLLGVALGVMLFCFANEWLGFLPAVLVLIFYSISPNLAAHASLVTTDLGLTCFAFGAVYFLWRTCRHLTAFNAAGLSVCCALAVVTKYSGLVLGPIIVLLLVVALCSRPSITPRRAVGILAMLVTASVAAIWAVCGFQYAPSDSASWVLHLEKSAAAMRGIPEIARLVAWIDAHRLLPNVFTQGFLVFAQSMDEANPAFLAGRYSNTGWWYFFPIAFLIKTPVALVVLLSAGLVVYTQRRRELGLANELFVVVPIVVYLGLAMTSRLNIGLRHILPIYPFVLLVAGAAARELCTARPPIGRLVLAGLIAFWLVTFARVYPDTLTFFNVLVGGAGNGSRYLVDSNLDWGQHLKRLKQWMNRQGVSHVNLAYFGTADPAYYGIEWTALPGSPFFADDSIAKPRLPGYVAVSATTLSGVYLDPRWRLLYRELQTLRPDAAIGNSIRVYWVDRWPEPAAETITIPADVDAHRELADVLLSQEWFDHAITHYRVYLRFEANDADVLANLGRALIATDQIDEAIPILRRAASLAPANAMAHRNLAMALFAARYDIADVLTHARRAVMLTPNDVAALDALGRALAVHGDFDQAIAMFERAIAIDPAYADVREHLDRLHAFVSSLKVQR